MGTTIQQALHPLLITFSIIGLGIYSSDKSRPYLNIVYSLIVWIAYGCLYCYIIIKLKVQKWFMAYFTMVNMQISILITIIYVVKFIRYDKKFRIFMKRLAAVDNTLEELGTPKMYRKLHIWVKRVIIVSIVLSSVENINDMIWWSYTVNDHRVMILPYIINYNHHVNMFMDLSFTILIWYVGTRFNEVNEHVRYLLMKEEHGLRCTWRKAVPTTRRYVMHTDNYKHILWTSMHLHLELCKIASELNTIFGMQITIEMIAHLIFMTGLCYYSYIKMILQGLYTAWIYDWFDVYLLISIYTLRLFFLNCICERVIAKANEIEKIIHQLTNPLRYKDLRDEIYQFTLQLIYHPLQFTGIGFFRFGYGFLRKFFLTISTFVIIVVQLKTDHLMDLLLAFKKE